jgi:hypothetical protein
MIFYCVPMLPMDDSSYRLIFYLDKKESNKKSITIAQLYPKISTIAKFGCDVVKYEKYSPVKLANFEYFSITCGKIHHFRLKSG